MKTHTLRSLRETYKLTLNDLSRMTGISARKLARVEEGARSLEHRERVKLAMFFGVPEDVLQEQSATDPRTCSVSTLFKVAFRRRTLIIATLILLASINLLHPVFLSITRATGDAHSRYVEGQSEAYASINGTSSHNTNLPVSGDVSDNVSRLQNDETKHTQHTSLQHDWALTPTVQAAMLLRVTPTSPPTPMPEPTATPTPTPVSDVGLTADGPYGCPLQPTSGRVVMTQGYGVGTHEPAEDRGAVDLALGTPAETAGVLVVATHSGSVQVLLDSWPGGNQVTLIDYTTGWRTNYAHLSEVLVEQGQSVAAGQVIGLVGETGMATGPHLDYQVWKGSTNIDPTSLVQTCW